MVMERLDNNDPIAEQELDIIFRLVKARKEHKMSQNDLAEVIGVPVEDIRNMERYTRHPSLYLVLKAADALDISILKETG